MWVMSASGPTSVTMSSTVGWRLEVAGDFNNDRRHDLLWRNTSGVTVIWHMNGTTYTSSTLPTRTSDWSVGIVGDLDGNGAEDVVWRNTNGSVAAWLMSNGAVASQSSLPGVDPLWIMYGKY